MSCEYQTTFRVIELMMMMMLLVSRRRRRRGVAFANISLTMPPTSSLLHNTYTRWHIQSNIPIDTHTYTHIYALTTTHVAEGPEDPRIHCHICTLAKETIRKSNGLFNLDDCVSVRPSVCLFVVSQFLCHRCPFPFSECVCVCVCLRSELANTQHVSSVCCCIKATNQYSFAANLTNYPNGSHNHP